MGAFRAAIAKQHASAPFPHDWPQAADRRPQAVDRRPQAAGCHPLLSGVLSMRTLNATAPKAFGVKRRCRRSALGRSKQLQAGYRHVKGRVSSGKGTRTAGGRRAWEPGQGRRPRFASVRGVRRGIARFAGSWREPAVGGNRGRMPEALRFRRAFRPLCALPVPRIGKCGRK